MTGTQTAEIRTDKSVLTERCRLRFPDVADIPHIWTASRTPGFNDGLSWEPPIRLEDIHEPLRRAQTLWKNGIDYNFVIESRDEKAFIGWIAIHSGDTEGTWSIGYWIHPAQQGNGYAVECARAIVKFGFSVLHASLITASHASWNSASGHVLRRAGLTYRRTNPRGFKKLDAWVEVFEYDIRFDG
ncbi:MAG: GNAT family N-acetyltransferase [Pseudomonadota bacterium]